MPPNINDRTGYPYGVSTRFQDLIEHIFEDGTDATYAETTEELNRDLHAVSGPHNDYDAAVEAFSWTPAHQEIGLKWRACYWDEDTMSLDVEAILDDASDRLLDCDGEHEYHLLTEKTKYVLSWFGGAPMVWVMDSEFVTHCVACSPCVPGAGDLDTPCAESDGWLAHCPPPEDLNYDDAGFDVVYRITKTNELNEVYRRTHADT